MVLGERKCSHDHLISIIVEHERCRYNLIMAVILYEFEQVLSGSERQGGCGDREDEVAVVFGVGVRGTHYGNIIDI